MATTTAGQAVKLQFYLKSFRENVRFMERESEEEMQKTLISGASAYATSAAKHSPPSMGSAKIDPIFYADGVLYDRSSARRSYGRRRIYDLQQLARNPDTGHYRKMYGKMLRQGYYYVVAIHRAKSPVRFVPCRTESEALQYAHESYRGLTRAAWGLNFTTLAGKMPPAFRQLVAQRPLLANMAALNVISRNPAQRMITITNSAIKTGDNYLQSLDTNASLAAVRTMNDRMTKFFKKKFNL